MTTRSYSFHGLKLSVSGENVVLDALHARLGRFPVFPDLKAPDAAELHFEFRKVADVNHHRVSRPAGAGRSVLDPGLGELLYFDASQQLYLEVPGRGRALCDVPSRQVHIEYPESQTGDPWLLAHLFFTVPLAELLKRQGFYMVHAAGLAVTGKGLLVVGQSGSGKTTLALTLLRAGFDFLADDTVFLNSGKTGLRLLAFPDEVDVTAQTVGFFPELHGLMPKAGPDGHRRPKQGICATTLYGVRPCWDCTPQAMVFPKPNAPGKSTESTLAPMPKSEALMQMVCNVLRTEPRSSQAHLDALAALVRDCPCYRLQTGRDFDRLPGLLRSLLNDSECHLNQEALR
jgi:hypothetical protein